MSQPTIREMLAGISSRLDALEAPQAAGPVQARKPSRKRGDKFLREVIIPRAQRRAAKVAAGTHKVARCGHTVNAARTAPDCKACTWRR